MFYGVASFINDVIFDIIKCFVDEDLADEYAERLNEKAVGWESLHYLVVRLVVLPPKGWSVFGTHMDYGGEIEFTKELDFDGYPIGERPALTRDRGSDRMTG